MKTFFKFSALIFISILLFGCETNNVNPTEENKEELELANASFTTRLDESLTSTTNSLCLLTDNLAPLTEDDVNSILYMREEEKLAHDVYVFFYEKYKRIPFKNISKSELAHQKAIAWLIDRYNIDAPTETKFGEFTIEELQNLYTKLITEAVDVISAFKVGAYIEEHDIMDLKNHLLKTKNPFVTRIYSNLLRASQFHLKAFVANLKFNGVTYQPQILSVEEYEAIINK